MIVPVFAVFGIRSGDLLEIQRFPTPEIHLPQTVVRHELRGTANQLRTLQSPQFRADKRDSAVQSLPNPGKRTAVRRPRLRKRRIGAPDKPPRKFRRKFSVTDQNKFL